jgi:regulator of RNase E activity RraA
MIMAAAPIGFRIYTNTPRPSAEVLSGFRDVPTGHICDAMDRLSAMEPHIRPLSPQLHMSGPALTVRTRPGDNLMVWKAIDVAKPGDVLVIATYGHTTVSTFGEFVVMAAKAKGIAGIVCDGLCRDQGGIRDTGVPTYTAGSAPSSPTKDGPGEIGGAVTCGGLVVHSGDIVVGDEDGVVVVPQGDAGAVLEALKAVREKEAKMLAAIQGGQLVPPAVLEAIAAKGVEIIG